MNIKGSPACALCSEDQGGGEAGRQGLVLVGCFF